MDAKQFDTLARSLTDSRSRRRALAAVVGGTLGLAGLTETQAKKKKPCPPCKKRKQGKCKGTLMEGTPCTNGSCQGGRCVATPPRPCVPACDAGAVCSDGLCVNGSLGRDAPCDAAVPGACSSGVCGCRVGSCTCRTATCLSESSPCTITSECCDGECLSAGTFGLGCFL